MAAAVAFEFAIVAITQQSIVVGIGFQINAATVAAIAAGRPATWNIFFAPERNAAVAAVAGLYGNFSFINKHGASSSWITAPSEYARAEGKATRAPGCGKEWRKKKRPQHFRAVVFAGLVS